MASPVLPLVSVVVPVYNAERYLGEALQSVLDQQQALLELIVVDDGSSDGSRQVAARLGSAARCVEQAHAGAAAARNHGARLASGNYLAFLDADDQFTPGKLAAQLHALQADRGLDMVFGHVRQFRDGTAPGQGNGTPAKLPGSLLIRRSSFDRVGAFRAELRVGEFVDWYLRASEAGLQSRTLPRVVLERRLHDDNLGLRERAARVDYVRALKDSLDRRRQA